MRKFSLIIVLLLLGLLLTSCSVDDTDVNSRLSPPDLKDSALSGRWLIRNYISLDSVDEHSDKSYYGLEALFHKEALIVGGFYSENPSYKMKRVKIKDYLLNKYEMEDFGELDLSDDYYELITLYDDGNNFAEFVQLREDRIFMIMDNSVLLMDKIADEVALEETLRYIEIEKMIDRDLQTADDKIQDTGILLGIKIPIYDERYDLPNWQYKTLWIRTKNGELESFYSLDDLLLPRANSFSRLKVERSIDYNWVYDQLKIFPQLKAEKNSHDDDNLAGKPSSTEEALIDLRNIDFLSPNYLALEYVDGREDSRKTKGIFALDKLSEEKPFKLSDLIGDEGKEIYEDGLLDVISIEEAKYVNESSLSLRRNKGHWVFMGRVNYRQKNKELFKDFNIRTIPPEDIVSHNELAISWDELKKKLPSTEDAFSSPNEDLLITMTSSSLRLYALEDGKLISNSFLDEYQLPKNSSVIMTQWANGRYSNLWEAEVIRKGGQEVIDR